MKLSYLRYTSLLSIWFYIGLQSVGCNENDNDNGPVLDTLFVNDTIYINDTLIINDTVTINDTITVIDTIFLREFGAIDLDGNIYKTLEIGNQEWFAENLRTTKYQNGDPITLEEDAVAWSTGETGYWSYYENNPVYDDPYGKLYNHYTIADERSLCPVGWRVPTTNDLQTLSDYFGGNLEAGAALKDTGLTYWESPNTGATNESGFTGVAGGGRGSVGEWISFGVYGRFWSSSEIDVYNAWGRTLIFDQTWFNRNQFNKHFGFSVRCVRDIE